MELGIGNQSPSLGENDCSNTQDNTQLNTEVNEETPVRSNTQLNTEVNEETPVRSNTQLNAEVNEETPVRSNTQLNAEVNEETPVRSNTQLNAEVNEEAPVRSNNQLNTEVNEETPVRSNTQLNAEVNEEAPVRSNTQLNTEVNEETPVRSNTQLNAEVNEEAPVRSNTQLNTEVNEEAPVRSNTQLNAEVNEETPVRSNTQLNAEVNEETPVRSNTQLNAEVNEETPVRSNTQLNAEVNEETPVRSNTQLNAEVNEEAPVRSNTQLNTEVNEETPVRSNTQLNAEVNEEAPVRSNTQLNTEVNEETPVRSNTQLNAEVNEEAPVRTRRGGRRGHRRSAQQQLTASTTTMETGSTCTTSKPMETVVVPVSGEAATSSEDPRPVNRTSVRRRAKATSTTVTKVVTGVSLEDLRAKRNGTAADGVPGGDAKTIEEVSRILFMYASRNPHGGKSYFSRRPGPFSSDVNLCKVGVEKEGDGVDAAAEGSGMDTTSSTPEGTEEKKSGLFVGELPHPDGDYTGLPDVYAHVMSLILSGDLPPKSLEVLHAMLSHTPRGGVLDPFSASRRSKHGFTQPGFQYRMGDAMQQGSQRFFTCFDYCSQQQQQQQLELMGLMEENFWGYGGFNSYIDQSYMHGMGCSQFNMMPFYPHPMDQQEATPDHAYSNERAMSYSFLGEQASQHEEAYPIYNHGVKIDGAGGYEGYIYPLEEYEKWNVNKKEDGINSNHNNNNININTNAYDDDDDDDADVTAMLQDVRDAVQRASSPRQLGDANSLNDAVAGSLNGSCNEHSEETPFSSSLPAPCVTISQTERDSLRSFQQAFLARMRVTGSPEWNSPGATSPRSLLRALVDDNDVNDLTLGQPQPPPQQLQEQQQQQQQEQEDDADDGRYTTNRTLFSYRTTFLDEEEEGEYDGGSGDLDDILTPDEPAPRGDSVATTAAPRESHHQPQPQQQQQQQPQEQEHWQESCSETTSKTGQFSLPFSAMRGDAAEDTQEIFLAAESNLWSWTPSDGKREGLGAEGATVKKTTAATPSRRWLYVDEPKECYTFSATPQQPTTQKKQVRWKDDHSPYFPAAWDLAVPMFPAMLGMTSSMTPATTMRAIKLSPSQGMAKTSPAPLNFNAIPFIPSRAGV
ncbi:hypothetical protein C3747_118g79 [Trypanosoma cruzi]|uniref:Uncharacterized protein n=2 Tax=Trypanosoma cruzi TaxID=5693 RepID=Q4CWJ0_TRYCC|nr:hypothetical protein, conserved [Trypanosoma cruzi]EAN84643.1 hypothetical protein, conserved [Trypanosoma cruzi]PWV06208.1 hypothetical protein C3747_118g79 [Trypanosoma cruzi]|eukprot:XP_806494.1 hypothetical protein [Trypanosoma cruzi strain CL Brener]